MHLVEEPKTFFQQGDVFVLGHDNPSIRYEKLPVGTYLVGCNPMQGWTLEVLPDFELPKKLYGDVNTKAERILNTYKDRPKSTGVLLAGEKGSGKTLLSKTISILGAQKGYPTLIVNQPFCGDGFNTFLQDINQNCIVLFDEFEKVYDDDGQKQLLTLFDGIFSSKKLLILTTNEYLKVNDHLRNRPGRLYYFLDFRGLDNNFIMEYGRDNLKNKAHVPNLGVVASMVQPISFDILQALVEECNRYGETPVKALDMLNIKQQMTFNETFTMKFEPIPGSAFIKLDPQCHKNNEIRTSPFHNFEVNVIETYSHTKNKKKVTEDRDNEYYFTPQDMVAFSGEKGIYEFVNQ